MLARQVIRYLQTTASLWLLRYVVQGFTIATASYCPCILDLQPACVFLFVSVTPRVSNEVYKDCLAPLYTTIIAHSWQFVKCYLKKFLGFTPPSPLIFTPTGFGSHLLLAQRSDRARWCLCRLGLTRSTCDLLLPSLTLHNYYNIISG